LEAQRLSDQKSVKKQHPSEQTDIGSFEIMRRNNSDSVFWITIYAVTVGCLLSIMYLPVLTYGFINFDEIIQVKINPLVRSLEPDNLRKIFTSFSIRSYYPIRLLSYAIDYHFWGLNPIGYHLTNLLLHILNTLLVFWLVFRLIGDVETGPDDRAETCAPPGKNPDYRLASAAAAACIFGIHPVVVEVAAWVGAREELLMALFALLCIHCWTHAKQLQQSRRTRRAVLFYVLSAAFCIFSCLSNAMGILIPAIIVVYEKTLGRTQTFRHSLRSTWLFWLIAFAAFVLKLMGRSICDEQTLSNPFTRVSHFDPSLCQRLLIIPTEIWENLVVLLWPTRLTILYPNWVPRNFFSADVIFGLMALLLIIVFLVFVKRHKMVVFGMLWFLIAMAPSCQIVPGFIVRSDRFMYFPWAGLALVIGYAIYAAGKRLRARMSMAGLLLAVVLCLLGFRTVEQLETWKNTITAFSHAADINYASNVPHLIAGRTLFELREVDRAIWHLEMAERIDPNCADTRFALGFALAYRGDHKEAIEHLEQGLRLDPYSERAKDLLASLYEAEKVTEQQEQFLEQEIVPRKAHSTEGSRSYHPFSVAWRDFLDWIKQKTTGKEPVQPAGATQGDAAIGAD
jgi:hypothetical protein